MTGSNIPQKSGLELAKELGIPVKRDRDMKAEHKCQVETYRGGTIIAGVGYYSPCGKPATTQLPNGEWVCRYHSPDVIAKREESKHRLWDLKAVNRRKGIGRKQRTL